MIDKLIVDTLKPLEVPVSKFVYRGNDTTYITFNTYLQKSVLNADDVDKVEGYYIQVSIFSKDNYNLLVKNMKDLLKVKGFIIIDEKEFYEKDTEYFHKAIRYLYTKASDEKWQL